MSIRKQLLLVSLLTLALPFAGYGYVREMESALRQGQEEALLGNARAVAGVLEGRMPLLFRYAELATIGWRPGRDVYAHPLDRPVHLDGYAQDWGLTDTHFGTPAVVSGDEPSFGARFLTGISDRYVYLFVEVTDTDVVFAAPDGGQGHDRVRLTLEDDAGRLQRYVIAPAAPGRVNPVRNPGEPDAAAELRIQGIWELTASGYHLELRIPVELTGARLGFAAIDGGGLWDAPPRGLAGTMDETWEAGYLMYPQPELGVLLQSARQEGQRLEVVERNGLLLGAAGAFEDRPAADRADGEPSVLTGWLYGAILSRELPAFEHRRSGPGRLSADELEAAAAGDPRAAWYRTSASGDVVLAAAWPVRRGSETVAAVVLEQTSEAILTLTNRALTRLLTLTLAVTAVAAIGLLGFATRLSLRIRRLRNATEGAISPEGAIAVDIPGTGERDELGDLSRSFATLLGRLREYTDYLRTLASKLSHELNTPLAVVKSSLDNLETEPLSDEARLYAERAREGADRLRAILTAMSEATRVEQSISGAEPETFDLNELLAGNIAAYRDVYPGRRFELDLNGEAAELDGVPDLVAQLLDKLIDNAVDFSPVDGRISVTLRQQGDAWCLTVANEGPLLPENMTAQLFDSMVSMRTEKGDGPHLGFGLFIARLIAAFHGGTIVARNLDDGSGAAFDVTLKREFPTRT